MRIFLCITIRKMQNVKNLRIPFIRSARATLTRLTFTRAREYFIGHKKYRSALGCKSLKSYEGSGSPPFHRRASQEGTLGEKGRIRKDAKEESHGSFGRRDTRGKHERKEGCWERKWAMVRSG